MTSRIAASYHRRMIRERCKTGSAKTHIVADIAAGAIGRCLKMVARGGSPKREGLSKQWLNTGDVRYGLSPIDVARIPRRTTA